MRPLVSMFTLELRYMEEMTTEDEIREAFIAVPVEVTPDQVKVKALRVGPRTTKVALAV